MGEPSVVVVTPVKDEAWILDRFLHATSTWADVIVVADQQSGDESRDIARSHPKVRLIDNPSPAYDEGARQRLLLTAAREVRGPRVIFALDADEMLGANAHDHDLLPRVKRLEPGTAVFMRWANLLPGAALAWVPSDDFKVFAFVDDGREHQGTEIHSARLPVAPHAPSITERDVPVLHFQYTWWSRMKSKQRWYQCWEILHRHEKRPIQIYRQYHFMDAIPPCEVRPVDQAWFSGYKKCGTKVLAEPDEQPTGWDAEVLDWILEHEPRRFARIDLWEVDWLDIARRLGRSVEPRRVADPRTPFERRVMAWLGRTQPFAENTPVRTIQRLLIPFGW